MGGLLEVLGSGRKRLRRGTRAFRREVDVGAARVFVDHGFQWDGSRNVWLTRARAPFVLGAGPRFRLRPRGLLERLVGWHSGQPSGDPAIDDFFVAHADDSATAWSALTTRTRSLLAQTFADAELISDGVVVVLWREGDFGRESDADAAIELVSEVVSFRSHQFERWRRLPGAIYRPARGGWEDRVPPSILLHLPAPVELRPVAGAGGAALAVSAPCGMATVRFSIDFGGAGPGGDGGDIVGRAVALAARLGPRRLFCDGDTVELHWPGLEVDRERLLAGARLITALAGSGYRALYR